MQRLKDKLRPCPFCGSSKLTTKNILTNGMQLVGIVCCCGCELTAPTVHEAVEKWNSQDFKLLAAGEYADEPTLNPA